MLRQLDSYDWEMAFWYTCSNKCGFSYVERALPNDADTPTTFFERDDVEHILAIKDAEANECNWILVGRLTDGRWFALVAASAYTGWDVGGGGTCRVAASEEEIIRFGLSSFEREEAGLHERISEMDRVFLKDETPGGKAIYSDWLKEQGIIKS